MRTRKSFASLAAAIFLAAVFMIITDSNASDLKSMITQELEKYYDTPFDVTVIQPGEIVIKGEVRSYWDKRNVYAIVSRVHGVTQITDALVVETEHVPDRMIEANIERDMMLSRAIIEPEKIKIKAESGLVVLSGTVSFAREASVAEDIASWHTGVLSVANEISVMPPKQAMSDANLTALIKSMIDRDFTFEKSSVKAICVKGTVTLTGSVDRLWTKFAIAKEIKRIQGVIALDNQIRVTSRVSEQS